MVSNTKSDSPSPVPPRLPKFEWPARGDDCPRLDWPSWLALLSDSLAREIGGETGLFLASIVGAMSCQARELGATSPSHQEQLAQEEADRASAWLLALEQEVAQPGGHWELSIDLQDQYDDASGDQAEDGPMRGWLSRNSEDETWVN